MMMANGPNIIVRPMRADDLDETLDMWVAAWQVTYPQKDFAAQRGWTADRIAELERGGSRSIVAARDERIVGALVINPDTGYLDQLVVATECQGHGVAAILLAEAQRVAACGLDLHVNQDNARAIAFYRKHAFTMTGEDVNPRSGAPIYRMSWRP
jgi:putative acetyltransferase